MTFEKVVVDCPEQFRQTQQNISKLKDLHASLEQQAERARQQATELREIDWLIDWSLFVHIT